MKGKNHIKIKWQTKQTTEFCKLKIFLILLATGFSLLVLIQYLQESHAVKYSIHSSDRYQIQFQYPTNWQLMEKTSRFDYDVDVIIVSPMIDGLITVQLMNETGLQALDFRSMVHHFYQHSSSILDDTFEYRSVEQPSFTTIDNQEAGTYLFTTKDKHGTSLKYPKLATQHWIVKTPHSFYLITFTSPTEKFDSPETTKIHNHFINSVKFLNLQPDQTQSDQFSPK